MSHRRDPAKGILRKRWARLEVGVGEPVDQVVECVALSGHRYTFPGISVPFRVRRRQQGSAPLHYPLARSAPEVRNLPVALCARPC